MFRIYNTNGGCWGTVESEKEAISICNGKGIGYRYVEESEDSPKESIAEIVEEIVEESEEEPEIIELKKRGRKPKNK